MLRRRSFRAAGQRSPPAERMAESRATLSPSKTRLLLKKAPVSSHLDRVLSDSELTGLPVIDIPASNGAVRAFTFLASSGEKHSCLFITTSGYIPLSPNSPQGLTRRLADRSLHLVALPLSSGPPSLLHSSPSLSTPTILHLTHQYAWAYSARGTLVRVDRSTNEAAQWETGIGANIAVWLADRKIAVFEQKGGRICILELDGEDGVSAFSFPFVDDGWGADGTFACRSPQLTSSLRRWSSSPPDRPQQLQSPTKFLRSRSLTRVACSSSGRRKATLGSSSSQIRLRHCSPATMSTKKS